MKNQVRFYQVVWWFLILVYILLFIFARVVKGSYSDQIETALLVAMLIGIISRSIYIFSWKKKVSSSLVKFADDLGDKKQHIINSLKLPIVMTDEKGQIIWYNNVFRSSVIFGNDLFGSNIKEIIENFNLETFESQSKLVVRYKEKIYDVYISLSKTQTDKEKKAYIMFFIESTRREKLEKEIVDNKPIVMMINIDNYEDIFSSVSVSEKNKIINNVETVINEYFGAGTRGIIRKIEKDLFVVVQERKYVQSMINNKFVILDKIRAITDNAKAPVTLSIGVGLDASNISESETMAKQSLDMALGRGGDQVVIKRNDSFEFFGGLSSGQVKSVKVKTRIVASSLIELIKESDSVVIMGHRFADLDCFGAAIGMAKGVKLIDQDRDVYIVIDQDKNMASALYDKVKNSYLSEIFISPDEVGDYLNKNTLLVILDTHMRSCLESLEVYQSCRQVVVIDHHRRAVDHINDAVIFYHEPSASSTCEMVTELVQYFSNKDTISSLEANALLSGIMLDTRNFVFKTGVRTFEAAAYLKKQGANTVEVKKLFSSSMESYQEKTKIVSVAEIYKKCAISVSDEPDKQLRVVAAQAADELLTINDIDASFVIYRQGEKVMISARSLGTVNVQVIMEFLGGGGHLSMAGAQIEGLSVGEVKDKLLLAIDKYYES